MKKRILFVFFTVFMTTMSSNIIAISSTLVAMDDAAPISHSPASEAMDNITATMATTAIASPESVEARYLNQLQLLPVISRILENFIKQIIERESTKPCDCTFYESFWTEMCISPVLEPNTTIMADKIENQLKFLREFYLPRINNYLTFSPVCYIFALIYIEKIAGITRKNTAGAMTTAIFPTTVIKPQTIIKLFFMALLLAIKWHDEKTLSMIDYAKVAGIHIDIFLNLEKIFIRLNRHDTFVSIIEFNSFMKDFALSDAEFSVVMQDFAKLNDSEQKMLMTHNNQ